VFPVRYELNSYINLLRNSVFKGVIRVQIYIASGAYCGAQEEFINLGTLWLQRELTLVKSD
jgi:hypothetical protein